MLQQFLSCFCIGNKKIKWIISYPQTSLNINVVRHYFLTSPSKRNNGGMVVFMQGCDTLIEQS